MAGAVRSGNVRRRMVVQAGQVLVHRTTQLATLSRRELSRCVEQLKRDCAGEPLRVQVKAWNGHPIDVSPVADLLWQLGFRFESPREMGWPPRRAVKVLLTAPFQDTFFPYYLEPPPVDYGPEWTISRAAEAMRPALRSLLGVLFPELERRDWQLVWGDDGLRGRYRDFARSHLRVAKSFVNFTVATPTGRHMGERRRFHRGLRVSSPDDVNDDFAARLEALLGAAEESTDAYHALKGGERPRES